jgi:DNA-binding response OmpR family regulator
VRARRNENDVRTKLKELSSHGRLQNQFRNPNVDEKTLTRSAGLRRDQRRIMRVLLIEQDIRVRQSVEVGLGEEGFLVMSAGDGAAGVELLRRHPFDLVLVDLTLPDVNGLALLAAIRTARPRLPVIALTTREDGRSLRDGFDNGADDCVTKPFSMPELAARIRARSRLGEEDGTIVEAGPLKLDLAANRALVHGNRIRLSARESALLAVFLRHAGYVLSRNQLLRLVWEIDFDPGSNVVDVYVAALRRKLGPQLIETVRGHGYRLRVSALESEVFSAGG